jgi:cytochrome d ubiquinol oxidase subunit II
MPDYETLRLIWWLLLGVLLVGFAVTDGYDLGTAILLPFVARTDEERRIVINTVGPVWEGSQVWLILGGGATFAAWPALYAVAFSGFYFAMLLLLCALILRPVGFKYRSKLADPRWRALWDWALFAGGLVPALVFGVAFGNVLLGVPFRFDDTLRLSYAGGFLGLFTPFALLAGVISIAMLTLHGAAWLAGKTEGAVRARACRTAPWAGGALLVLFILAGIWASRLDAYALTGFAGAGAPSNPLAKMVVRAPGGLLANYVTHPWLLAAPLLTLVLTPIALALLRIGRKTAPVFATGLAVAGVIATAGVSLFPFLLPSSLEPNASLTVWDASSSRMTLWFMTLAVATMLPVVVLYTAWIYRVLRGPVTRESVAADPHSY